MTGRLILSSVIALFITFLSMSAAVAAGGLPEPLATELTQYPGSKVLDARSLPGNNHIAQMDFGRVRANAVYKYYKNKMIKNGFTIQVEVDGTTIVGKKGNLDVVVGLEERNGSTFGTLSLIGPSEPDKPGGNKTPAAKAPPRPKKKEATGTSVSMASPEKQADYPAKLKKIVPQYPGSMVVTVLKNSKRINAMLGKKNCSLAEAAAYYKKHISKAGWKFEGEMNRPPRLLMEYSKSGRQFVINIIETNNAVAITLALSD